MNLSIDNTPLLWPAALSTGLLLFLTVYSWRRRSVPAALPFAVACAFSALWGLGAILELTAATVAAEYTWFRFQLIWILPAFSAIVCFVLEYANPGRWLTRRILILLSIIPVLVLLVIFANDPYHLLWLSPTHQDVLPLLQGKIYRSLIVYILLLGMINLGIFIWLFIRSPQHRLPVVFMVIGQLTARALYLLGTSSSLLFDPTRTFSIFAAIPFTMYAIALFRFRIFDPVPFARQAALEQMSEGMLVIDPQRRVASLNKSAEKSLGTNGNRLHGSPVTELVPKFDQLVAQLAGKESVRREIKLHDGEDARLYEMDISSLKDHRGGTIGHLIMFRDISEQKQAQAVLMEQQRVLATLMERERLARELHDSLGQVLGYVSMQAQSIRKRFHDGDLEAVESQLARLADVAQQAHAEVRDSIISLKTGHPQDWSFIPALQLYLNTYRDQYGIQTGLELEPDSRSEVFDPETGVQLMRVIQEALTNAREHGQAHSVQVQLLKRDGHVRISVCDDGVGFKLDQALEYGRGHFGLAFMRERMEQIGGSLEIQSQPGAGTQVLLDAPANHCIR